MAISKQSARLSIVVDMAKRSEESAARQLVASRKELEEEEQRLLELDEYYREYEKSFANVTSGLRADALATNREFLQQLSQSRQLQKTQLERQREQFELAKKHWHRCHLKYDNLKSFVKKVAKQELDIEEKKEQKTVDEWVTQNYKRE